jgi:nicotinamide mononucleotide transporter
MNTFAISNISDLFLQTAFSVLQYEISILELIAVVTGLIGVWLGTTGKKSTWPWWALSSVLYSWLFYEWELYASAALQFVFIAAAIWGWFGWGPKGAQPKTATAKQRIVIGLIAVASWLIIAPALASVGAAATWPDSFGLVFSVVAQVIMVRQYTETWVVWLVVDLAYTVLYATQGLWFTSILYLVLTGIALRGLLTWQNKLTKREIY